MSSSGEPSTEEGREGHPGRRVRADVPEWPAWLIEELAPRSSYWDYVPRVAAASPVVQRTPGGVVREQLGGLPSVALAKLHEQPQGQLCRRPLHCKEAHGD